MFAPLFRRRIPSISSGSSAVPLILDKSRRPCAWFQYLKGAHEIVIDGYHATSIVEFAAIVGS
jgi:hypothetical protein